MRVVQWGLPAGRQAPVLVKRFGADISVNFCDLPRSLAVNGMNIARVHSILQKRLPKQCVMFLSVGGELIRAHRIRLNLLIECRTVKDDELWLSPAYRRDSAYIAVHMYKGMPHQDYFNRVETTLQVFGRTAKESELTSSKTN